MATLISGQTSLEYAPAPVPNEVNDLKRYLEHEFIQLQAALQVLYDNSKSSALTYYGSFYDTTIQSITSVTDTYVINIGSTDASNGVSIVGGSKMTFANAGIYNIQFSVQFTNNTTQIKKADIWLKKNGVNIPTSNSKYSINETHGGNHGGAIAAINFIATLAAGDYIQLAWHADSTGVAIETFPAESPTPIIPVTPGVILTAILI
jgi:hypothetical protein